MEFDTPVPFNQLLPLIRRPATSEGLFLSGTIVYGKAMHLENWSVIVKDGKRYAKRDVTN